MPKPSPLARIRLGAIILCATVACGLLGFRFLGGYDWIGSLWMVVITISTVGYGESSDLTPTMQLLTIAVILVGLTAAGYTFGGLFRVIIEGEIQQALGKRRMTHELKQLTEHIVICGYGRIGRNLTEGLKECKQRFVVIEQVPELIEEARALHYLALQGDATEESVLLEAGVDRAHSLITGLPSDAANVFITLTARNLNPRLQIISRAEHPSTEQKLRQAGANRVVLPTIISAKQMVRMIMRPSTADLMDLMTEVNVLDVELDEVHVERHAKLIGVSVAHTEAHRRHQLLVVAVKQQGGDMVFNPDARYCFSAGDILIIMGHREHIEQFREHFHVD